MVATEWPFRPLHITNDGQQAQDGSPLTKLTGPGIISNNYLAACQSEICHRIEQPTTLVEFSPAGEPVRTDSPLLQYRMHPACRCLRQWRLPQDSCGAVHADCLCMANDAAHARIFGGLTRAQVEANLPSCVPFFADPAFSAYDGEPSCAFEHRTISGRTALIYDCPLLGYREGVFPIYLEHRVIAVLFAGQIVLADRVAFIRERISTLPHHLPQSIGSWPSVCDERYKTPDDLVRRLLDANDSWLQKNSARVLTDSRYLAQLEQTCHEVSRLEDRLADELAHQRQRYISERTAARIEQFRKLLPQGSVRGQKALDGLWQDLEGTLMGVRADFAFKYLAVFGIKSPTPKPASRLQIVARTGELPANIAANTLQSVELELKAFTDGDAQNVVFGPNEHGSLLARAFRGVSPEALGDFVLVLVDVPHHPLSSIAILVGYTEVNPSSADENRPDGALDRALQSFNTLVVSSLSAILAATSERDIDDRLRILRHEVGQLTSGMDALRLCYLKNPDDIGRLRGQKAEDLCRDLEGYLKHIHLFFELVKYSVEDLPKLSPKLFLAFRELLYKWKDTYRLEAKKKRIEFCLPRVTKSDEERPSVYGDQNLLEQLVYNLVNNAVKCCHRGTRIYLDCSLETSNPDAGHLLTVTNYGVDMPPGDQYYDLYVRGEDAPAEGLGIGLWLAKKIALAHGGKIWHSSDLVSPFNVPLMRPYLRLPFSETDPALARQIRQEHERLKVIDVYSSILAMYDAERRLYQPTRRTVLKSVIQPTYRVTLHVKIPSGGKGGAS